MTALWLAIQLLGAIAIAWGANRALRAPALAAVRSEATGANARGLTDFYRISGGLCAFVGVILVVVPIVAR